MTLAKVMVARRAGWSRATIIPIVTAAMNQTTDANHMKASVQEPGGNDQPRPKMALASRISGSITARAPTPNAAVTVNIACNVSSLCVQTFRAKPTAMAIATWRQHYRRD